MSNESRILEPHTLIFKEGDEAHHLYLIKTGEVLCLKSNKERLVPVFKGRGKDIIGESAMLSETPYTYSAVTLTRVELIIIEHADFHDVLKEAPQWLTGLALTMVERFQTTASLVAKNRVFHQAIMTEEEFTPSAEIEFKKLLNQ
jgi:CRP-like cAMP-binding protein